MRKVYRLKNGFSISKGECYDGYNMQTYWGIYEPNGTLYRSCHSYNEAYELASHLRPRSYEDGCCW
jgi:hypothetical protein